LVSDNAPLDEIKTENHFVAFFGDLKILKSSKIMPASWKYIPDGQSWD